jgi:O-antigen/teichoic acid export membrane protein
MLAAPVAVLGIPGSFGRYVEHFRARGQLHGFLRNTTIVSVLLAIFAVGAIALARDWFSWMIFDNAERGGLVVLVAATLLAVIANNFLGELFTALRQMRVVSLIQLGNSVLFAAVGLSLLLWRTDAAAIIAAYGIACVVTGIGAAWVLVRQWRELPHDEAPLAQTSLWQKLMPFAVWVWLTNLVVNMFAVANRFMMIHFSGESAHDAAVMVGNFHSASVMPVLMSTVAGMLSGMLLPHLSRDWEHGRREAVGPRVNLAMKCYGLATMCGSVVLLAASPILFGVVLAGKYDGGLSVLPWALIYCAWFSLALLAETYLWCAERPRLACLIYAIGLAANIGLALVILPLYGLLGAMLATCAGNGVVLLLSLWFNERLKMQRDVAVWLVCALPLALPLGAWVSAIALAAALLLAWRSSWLFTAGEKQMVAEALAPYLRKLQNMTDLLRLTTAQRGAREAYSTPAALPPPGLGRG